MTARLPSTSYDGLLAVESSTAGSGSRRRRGLRLGLRRLFQGARLGDGLEPARQDGRQGRERALLRGLRDHLQTDETRRGKEQGRQLKSFRGHSSDSLTRVRYEIAIPEVLGATSGK